MISIPQFKTLEEAEIYIRAAIIEALNNEVLQVIQLEEAKQINDLVYGAKAYSPRLYERRWDLSDTNNMVGNVKGLSLSVENVTPPSDYVSPILANRCKPPTLNKNLSEVVEYGEGYDWYSPGARPFTQATVEALKKNKKHIKAIKKKLRSKGIVVAYK